MRRFASILFLLAVAAFVTAVHADAAPPRVLVFSKTEGWRHDSIPVAVETLRRLVGEAGMAMDATEDSSAFDAANLARYRIVVFANTTGDVLDPAQQRALETFVRRGGGFLGVHSAADTEHDWPWYGQLVGAYFRTHPPGLQASRVQPERDGEPVGDGWPARDELYNYADNPRPRVRVVATVDERAYEGGTMGADHPIAWCRAFDGGRAWYTGLGHDRTIYARPEFLAQLRQGLRYAAGRSDDC